MKAYARRNYSKRERAAIQNVADYQAHRAIVRSQWLWMIAMNDELKSGEKKIMRVLNRYFELAEQYGQYKEEDEETADWILEERVKKLMPNVFTKLYEK